MPTLTSSVEKFSSELVDGQPDGARSFDVTTDRWIFSGNRSFKRCVLCYAVRPKKIGSVRFELFPSD